VTDDLRVAQRAAMRGAAVAMRYFAALAGLRRERKVDGSVVTEADRAVERTIRAELAAARPGDAVLGEEGGRTGGDTGARRWIIDPIDGTALFVEGVDRWLVLLALEQDGEIVVGVAVVPAQGRIWWAGRGAGAYEAEIDLTGSDAAEIDAAGPDAAGINAANPGAAKPGAAGAGAAKSGAAKPGAAGAGAAGPGLAGIGAGRRIAVAPGRTGGLAGSRLGVLPAFDDPATGANAVPAAPAVAAPLLAVTAARPWTLHPPLAVARGDLDLAVQTSGQVWDFAATSLIVAEAGGSYRGLDGRRRPDAGPAVFARDADLAEAALHTLNRPAANGN
jgi:histidinol-phosphatase